MLLYVRLSHEYKITYLLTYLLNKPKARLAPTSTDITEVAFFKIRYHDQSTFNLRKNVTVQ